MGLTKEERESIINYRKERALKTLEEARITANNSMWNLTMNRLYYAVFYAAGALLVKNSIPSNSHQGTMRMLQLHFIKEGPLNKDDSSTLRDLYNMRITGDYEDDFDVTEEDIIEYLPKAQDLVERIINLIDKE